MFANIWTANYHLLCIRVSMTIISVQFLESLILKLITSNRIMISCVRNIILALSQKKRLKPGESK